MSTYGIEARGVWKKFRRGQLHDSLRDLIPAAFHRLGHRGAEPEPLARGDFWAVRDLDFTVRPGEALGIIGPNGAGKSTVLKLVTRILRPTGGEIRSSGRIGALIEIAAGFHPDLTGRENVYLQGAIMGMQRAEIARKFDEIVEFSGISEFIDTPVKRYSSGMNARLGFAIAAHLDPEVLIIDEVLAVGDFQFQEKAFERIRSIAAQGIPVIVVSHQLERIASLCNRAILLDRGAVVQQGTPTDCISTYILGASRPAVGDGGYPVRIDGLAVSARGPVRSGERIRLTLTGEVDHAPAGSMDAIEIRVRALQTGQLVYATSTDRFHVGLPANGPFRVDAALQMNVPLGVYTIETVVYDRKRQCVAAPGPFRTVEVEGGASFWGSVQLNARLELAGAAGAAVAM